MADTYRRFAVGAVNAVVALVAANLVLALAFRLTGAGAPSDPQTVGTVTPEKVKLLVDSGQLASRQALYPDLTPEQVATLVLEAYARPFQFDSFTQFREIPYDGALVHIDPRGFRPIKGQGPWPPDRAFTNVFVFGGSTTFGYGVTDDETIPSQLQELLAALPLARPARVYNLGRGYYFSSQERALFEKLLLGGIVPDVAVFVDGLNDFVYANGEPQGTNRMRALFAEQGAATEPLWQQTLELLARLPMGRAALWLRDRIQGSSLRNTAGLGMTSPQKGDTAEEGTADPRPPYRKVIDRMIGNQRLIAAAGSAYGVETLFVWQPVPLYKYDLSAHLFAPTTFGPHEGSRVGYPEVAKALERGEFGPRFVSCADIQENEHAPLYVDSVHYTPAASRRVAQCIVDGMQEAGTLAGLLRDARS